MRKLALYVNKYGQEHGTLIFGLLQKPAAQARWKAHYKNLLAR